MKLRLQIPYQYWLVQLHLVELVFLNTSIQACRIKSIDLWKKNPEHLGCSYIVASLLILTITMPMSCLATFSYK